MKNPLFLLFLAFAAPIGMQVLNQPEKCERASKPDSQWTEKVSFTEPSIEMDTETLQCHCWRYYDTEAPRKKRVEFYTCEESEIQSLGCQFEIFKEVVECN